MSSSIQSNSPKLPSSSSPSSSPSQAPSTSATTTNKDGVLVVSPNTTPGTVVRKSSLKQLQREDNAVKKRRLLREPTSSSEKDDDKTNNSNNNNGEDSGSDELQPSSTPRTPEMMKLTTQNALCRHASFNSATYHRRSQPNHNSTIIGGGVGGVGGVGGAPPSTTMSMSRCSSTESLLDDISSRAVALFQSLDRQGCGYLGIDELSVCCPDLAKEELSNLFKQLDRDNDGRISVRDFKEGFRAISRTLWAKGNERRKSRSRILSTDGFSSYGGSCDQLTTLGKRSFDDTMGSINILNDPTISEDMRGYLNNLSDGLGALQCQEQVCELYHMLATECPHLIECYEAIVLAMIDQNQIQLQDMTRLEELYHRQREDHESQLEQLDSVIEEQIKKEEEKIREQLTEKLNAAHRHEIVMKEQECLALQSRIRRLEMNIDQLKVRQDSDEDKLQLEMLRSELQAMNNQNTELKNDLAEMESQIAITRSDWVSLKQDYEERCRELQREKVALLDYMKEQDHLMQQIYSLRETNRELNDTNDNLRCMLERVSAHHLMHSANATLSPAERRETCCQEGEWLYSNVVQSLSASVRTLNDDYSVCGDAIVQHARTAILTEDQLNVEKTMDIKGGGGGGGGARAQVLRAQYAYNSPTQEQLNSAYHGAKAMSFMDETALANSSKVAGPSLMNVPRAHHSSLQHQNSTLNSLENLSPENASSSRQYHKSMAISANTQAWNGPLGSHENIFNREYASMTNDTNHLNKQDELLTHQANMSSLMSSLPLSDSRCSNLDKEVVITKSIQQRYALLESGQSMLQVTDAPRQQHHLVTTTSTSANGQDSTDCSQLMIISDADYRRLAAANNNQAVLDNNAAYSYSQLIGGHDQAAVDYEQIQNGITNGDYHRLTTAAASGHVILENGKLLRLSDMNLQRLGLSSTSQENLDVGQLKHINDEDYRRLIAGGRVVTERGQILALSESDLRRLEITGQDYGQLKNINEDDYQRLATGGHIVLENGKLLKLSDMNLHRLAMSTSQENLDLGQLKHISDEDYRRLIEGGRIVTEKGHVFALSQSDLRKLDDIRKDYAQIKTINEEIYHCLASGGHVVMESGQVVPISEMDLRRLGITEQECREHGYFNAIHDSDYRRLTSGGFEANENDQVVGQSKLEIHPNENVAKVQNITEADYRRLATACGYEVLENGKLMSINEIELHRLGVSSGQHHLMENGQLTNINDAEYCRIVAMNHQAGGGTGGGGLLNTIGDKDLRRLAITNQMSQETGQLMTVSDADYRLAKYRQVDRNYEVGPLSEGALPMQLGMAAMCTEDDNDSQLDDSGMSTLRDITELDSDYSVSAHCEIPRQRHAALTKDKQLLESSRSTVGGSMAGSLDSATLSTVVNQHASQSRSTVVYRGGKTVGSNDTLSRSSSTLDGNDDKNGQDESVCSNEFSRSLTAGRRSLAPKGVPTGKRSKLVAGNLRASMANKPSTSLAKKLQRQFKVVLAGDAAVGKSSFIIRVCDNRFASTTTATLGVDFRNKTIEIEEEVITIQLWDTAGQERFRSVAKSHFRRGDGVLLFYDCTFERSFVNVRNWIEDIKENGRPDIPIVIIANKVDMREEEKLKGTRVISYEEGRRLAQEYDALFMESSNKSDTTGHNVLLELAKLLRAQEDIDISLSSQPVDLKHDSDKKTSSCCKL